MSTIPTTASELYPIPLRMKPLENPAIPPQRLIRRSALPCTLTRTSAAMDSDKSPEPPTIPKFQPTPRSNNPGHSSVGESPAKLEKADARIKTSAPVCMVRRRPYRSENRPIKGLNAYIPATCNDTMKALTAS